MKNYTLFFSISKASLTGLVKLVGNLRVIDESVLSSNGSHETVNFSNIGYLIFIIISCLYEIDEIFQ